MRDAVLWSAEDAWPQKKHMIVEAQVTINGSRAAIWTAMTDIENASDTISGIEKI